MEAVDYLMPAIGEVTIANKVARLHDEIRMKYSLKTNTVSSFKEFEDKISGYCSYHMSRAVLHGGHLSRSEAAGRAKEIIDQEYRRHHGNINTAYNDAHDGTNGGLRIILDLIAERLKAESVERYIRNTFDRYVDPTSWEERVEIMRQFLSRYGHMVSSSIRVDQPERYAQNYEELITEYVRALQKTSPIFRRL